MKSRLARIPLRVKLVALALVLVAVALAVISVSSSLALQRYLVGSIDGELEHIGNAFNRNTTLLLPIDTFGYQLNADGISNAKGEPLANVGALPPVPQRLDQQARSHFDVPYTLRGQDGRTEWRIYISGYQLADGSHVVLGQNMSSVSRTITRLALAEVVTGLAVLALLAMAAIWLVRVSLRPLTTIEHTAAAIAAGDLTRRVPDFEPDTGEPRTEVGRLGRALNVMLRQIEAAFNAQAVSESRARRSEERMRRFVADASHELRTPLTTIRGFSELYRQGAVTGPERVADLLRRIEDEARRMGLLVEDLLLLARLDRERPLHLVPLDLRVIASEAVDAARAVAPERAIDLHLPPGGGPLTVRADEARMRQIIGNLMTNALVHTPAGTPVALRLGRDGGDAVIEVADRGPGMTPEQAEKVFERFYRIDAARTRHGHGPDGGGTGLGLAIVAALVAAHGGRVSVDSTVGVGSTFRVRLPEFRPGEGHDEAPDGSGGTGGDGGHGTGADPGAGNGPAGGFPNAAMPGWSGPR